MQETCRVFISYRNDQYGGFLAQLLKTKLDSDGYYPFYAPESMKSGKFDEQLYRRLDECRAVVAVLSPHALDPRGDREDWMRIELAYAMAHGVTIIPVMAEGFSWPAELPEDLTGLDRFQGISITDRLSAGQYLDLRNLLDDALGIGRSAEEAPCPVPSSSADEAAPVPAAAPDEENVAVEHGENETQDNVPVGAKLMYVWRSLLQGVWMVIMLIAAGLILYMDVDYLVWCDGVREYLLGDADLTAMEPFSRLFCWNFIVAVLLMLFYFAQKMAENCGLRKIRSEAGFRLIRAGHKNTGIDFRHLDMTAEELQKYLLRESDPSVMLEPEQNAEQLVLRGKTKSREIQVWARDMLSPVERIHVIFRNKVETGVHFLGLNEELTRKQADVLMIQQGFVWEDKKGSVHRFRKDNICVHIRFALNAVQEAEVCLDGSAGQLERANKPRGIREWFRNRRVYNGRADLFLYLAITQVLIVVTQILECIG